MKKVIKSFSYAWHGLLLAMKSELNLRIHLGAGVLVVIAGCYFKITRMEWAVLVIAVGFVLSLELVNTAIEKLADLVTKNKDPLAGKVKDIAAAAVMIGSMAAAIAGIIIFSNYIF